MSYLSIEYVSLEGRRETLFQKEVDDLRIVFGALKECDVWIDEEIQPRIASRDHCAIERLGDFELIYKARNPVWLDGKLVSSTQKLFPGDVSEHWIWLGAMPPQDPPLVKLREKIDPTTVGLAGRGHFRCVLHDERSAVPAPTDSRRKKKGDSEGRRTRGAISGVNTRIYLMGAGIGALLLVGGFAAGMYFPAQFDALLQGQERQRLRDVEMQEMLQPILETTAFQERARQSIYVVGTRLGGRFNAKGTAWVADLGGRPRLVTNWHVGDQLKAATTNGEEIVARRTVAPGRVEDIVLQPDYVAHPSYEAYQLVLDNVRASGDWPNVFDAAELSLANEDDRAKLGPPLTIAPDIFDLRSLQFVGYVGFPTEGLNVTKFNPAEPSATPIVGHIQKVTDGFQRQLTPVEHRLLVQTDLNAAGGASGSPLFDARGRVIGMVSGGDTMRLPSGNGEDVRISTGNFYAVRADVIEELGGRPAPADREAIWRCAVQMYGSADASGGCDGEGASETPATTSQLGPDGSFTTVIQGLRPGRYVLRAQAASPTVLRIRASWGEGKSTQSDATALEANRPEINLRLLQPSDVQLHLEGKPGDEFAWSYEPVGAGGAQ